MSRQNNVNKRSTLPPVVYGRRHSNDAGPRDVMTFPRRCNRVLPLEYSTVTDDVDRPERRRHRRGRRKRRRHQYEHRAPVNSGDQSADSVTSALVL